MPTEDKKPERGRKRTLVQVAAALGVSRGELDKAKREGINPYDAEEMKRWKANRNSYTPRGSADVPVEPKPDDGTRLTVEQIEDMASRPGLTKRDVDVYKGQLEVMKAATALREQQGKLISRAEVDERDVKIAHALNAMLRRFELEFPALALGLDLSKSKAIIKEKTRELQAALSDRTSEFWREHPEA